MKKNWTRRYFIESTVATTVTTRAGVATVAGLAPVTALAQDELLSLPGLDQTQQLALMAAVDEIIPAADGMPAASQIGVLQYIGELLAEDPSLVDALVQGLDFLGDNGFDQGFSNLSDDQRVEMLEALEGADPSAFNRLRNAVYEGYYTRPEVWQLMGYEPHPTNSAGPVMAPFDEDSLERVRQLPRLYREVE